MFGNFFKTEYAYFIKYYLYFIVLFCITTYANLYISKETTDIKVFEINKICFYMFFLFILIVVNDILDTPMMFLKKFIFIILFSLLLVYIANYFIIKYSKKEYGKTLLYAIGASILIYLIFIIGIYFFISTKGNKYSDPLYLQFNYGIYVNLSFFIFTALYPSISLLSLWGFVEWTILNWFNTHDTWNSFNFMLLNTKYNLIQK